MNKICKDYCDLIQAKFFDTIQSIIFYGSNIYDDNSSDLDVCVIVRKNNPQLQEKIINETLKFHLIHNLRIDDEVPPTNKLVYTIDEIEETLNNPPFYENGIVVIHDIVKNMKFLSSKEMKQRLLLNILTTDHLTVGESTKDYEIRALRIILDVIINYFKIDDKSETEILECMYQNKYTGATGEMYLGYKKDHKEKDKYLRKKIHEILK